MTRTQLLHNVGGGLHYAAHHVVDSIVITLASLTAVLTATAVFVMVTAALLALLA